MIKKSDISMEELMVVRNRMMITCFLGFAANWGARVTKDFEDTPHSSPHWAILYYGLYALYALGILVGLVYGARYLSHLRNNHEYLQLVRSKRSSRGQYLVLASSLLVTVLTAVVVRTVSPTVSITSLIDVALFAMTTTLGISLIVLKSV